MSILAYIYNIGFLQQKGRDNEMLIGFETTQGPRYFPPQLHLNWPGLVHWFILGFRKLFLLAN